MVIALSLSWAALPAVLAPAWAGDLAAGRQKAVACQPCHGLDGISVRPDAPHIAGENASYLEQQLKSFRSGARQHEVMSLVAAGLSDEDIADVVTYYAAIEIAVVKLPE